MIIDWNMNKCFSDILNLDPIDLATEVVKVIAEVGWDDFVPYCQIVG